GGGLVAATSAGLWKSRDAGRTWAPLSSALAGTTPRVLVGLPGDRRVLLAATGEGLFRSADRGLHWQSVAGGLPRGGLSALAPHPDGRTLYASCFDNGGIWRSTDGGTTWARLPGGDLPSARVWTIAVDPADPDRLFASSPSGLFLLNSGSIAVGDADNP